MTIEDDDRRLRFMIEDRDGGQGWLPIIEDQVSRSLDCTFLTVLLRLDRKLVVRRPDPRIPVSILRQPCVYRSA